MSRNINGTITVVNKAILINLLVLFGGLSAIVLVVWMAAYAAESLFA